MVLAMAEMPVFGPAEDLMLGVFKEYFDPAQVSISTMFESGMRFPAIIARQDRTSGGATLNTADPRFVMPTLVSVDTLCSGPNADEECAQLQEAARHAVYQAWTKQLIVPGIGYISKIENISYAYRASDWATSTGVVQYASLPSGVVRYERRYRLHVRPDSDQSRVTNPFTRTPRTEE